MRTPFDVSCSFCGQIVHPIELDTHLCTPMAVDIVSTWRKVEASGEDGYTCNKCEKFYSREDDAEDCCEDGSEESVQYSCPVCKAIHWSIYDALLHSYEDAGTREEVMLSIKRCLHSVDFKEFRKKIIDFMDIPVPQLKFPFYERDGLDDKPNY